MNIDMVSVLCYIRKNPNSSKDTIIKELKLLETKFNLAITGLKQKHLIIELANGKFIPKEKKD